MLFSVLYSQSTHEEKEAKAKSEEVDNGAAVPAYLLDRENTQRAKILSNTIKQKRKEKAGKWEVPVPKVKPITDDEMFRVITTGKRKGTCVSEKRRQRVNVTELF